MGDVDSYIGMGDVDSFIGTGDVDSFSLSTILQFINQAAALQTPQRLVSTLFY